MPLNGAFDHGVGLRRNDTPLARLPRCTLFPGRLYGLALSRHPFPDNPSRSSLEHPQNT